MSSDHLDFVQQLHELHFYLKKYKHTPMTPRKAKDAKKAEITLEMANEID